MSRREPNWRPLFCLNTCLAALLLSLSVAQATENDGVSGADIYAYCVECHGKRGEGGQDGLYPRIAGLPQPYIDRQLHAFKSQARVNKPMIPIFKHHRFDGEIIDLVSGHLAGLTPPALGLWPYEPDSDALASFADKSAYAAAGAETYAQACAECHGESGDGIDGADGGPPLVGQYPAYLTKQIGDFARGERTHAQSERCADLTPAVADAVVNHLVELGK